MSEFSGKVSEAMMRSANADRATKTFVTEGKNGVEEVKTVASILDTDPHKSISNFDNLRKNEPPVPEEATLKD